MSDQGAGVIPVTGAEFVLLQNDEGAWIGVGTTAAIAALAGGGAVDTGPSFAASVEYTNSILYTALTAGLAGNSITVKLQNDGASQTLAVTEAGDVVTVHLGTDGASVVTSLTSEVVDIINSDSTKIRAEGIDALYNPDAVAQVTSTLTFTGGADTTTAQAMIASAEYTATQITLPVDGVITPYPWMAVESEDAPFLAWGTAGEPFPRVCWFSGQDGLFLGDGTFDPYLGPAPNGEPLAYMQGGRDGEKTYFAFTAGLLKMYGGTTDAAHPGDHGGLSFKAIGDGAMVFSTADAGSGGGPSFEDASTMLFEIREGKTWKVQVHLGALGLYVDDSGPHLVVGIPAPIESDVKFDNNTVGPVIVDQSDGNTYRIICTNGVLQTELVP